MSVSSADSMTNRLLLAFHRVGARRSAGPLHVRLVRWASWGGFISMLVVSNPRARGNRARALARLWAWQLWRRVVRRPIVVSLEDGVRLRLPPWSTLAGVIAATGAHEPHERAFLGAVVRPGDFVVDVGANIGIHTVALAGLGAKVAAFEPGTEAREALNRNIALNSAEDAVRVFAMALSDHAGLAMLTTHLDGANHLADASDTRSPTEAVEIETLDGVVEANPDWFLHEQDVFLVKIDAEGHDEAVLRGADRVLQRCKPLILVETWEGGNRIRDLLARYGYRVYSYESGARLLTEYSADWSGQANFIAVPRERWQEVAARVSTAPVAPDRLPEIAWRA